jgi:dihydrofolate reductase
VVIEKLKLKKIIIAAVSSNGIIGNNGKIPWHSTQEFKHFKKTTIGFPVIFGRRTFESLGKPLKERLNIIISRNLTYQSDQNILIFSSLTNAYKYLLKNNYEKVFICGGREIYISATKSADEMIISFMKITVHGDTKFPKINFINWTLTKTINFKEFDVCYYQRKKKQ